jgi:hypothetical protein
MNSVKAVYANLVYVWIMGFKKNLKTELTYQDILVKELSVMTGISRHTLDNYLNVRGHTPSADTILPSK